VKGAVDYDKLINEFGSQVGGALGCELH